MKMGEVMLLATASQNRSDHRRSVQEHDMPDENRYTDDRYTNYDIRRQIEVVNQRVSDVDKSVTEVRAQQGYHEKTCDRKFTEILAYLAELRALVIFVAKWGFWLAAALFLIEIGKGAVAIPAIFDTLAHIH
jgi:hypothetical protein